MALRHGLQAARLKIERGLPRHDKPRRLWSDLINRVLSQFLAGYGLVFGIVAAHDALIDQTFLGTTTAKAESVALFASIIGVAIAGFLGKYITFAARVFAGLFAIVILTWPLLVSDPSSVIPGSPWPWSMANIAMAAAAFSLPRFLALAYLLALPGIYVLVRLTPGGGGAPLTRALSDGGYSFLLGLAVLLLMGMLRDAAAKVDDMHLVAIRRYAQAVLDHETELERVQVDSILHDSVLTTLLMAARADDTKSKQFAVAMSKHSLREIASSKIDPKAYTLVKVEDLRERFEAVCEELGIAVQVTTAGVAEHSLPSVVVEAFFAAALQALTNSVQHAGPRAGVRSLFALLTEDGVRVDITDNGVGFDLAAMTTGRLGVRVSIVERLRNVGGRATISSRPGEGTTVSLVWPAPPSDTRN